MIKGGSVVSFASNELLDGFNVGIKNGSIGSITRDEIDGAKLIDATGKVVSPGFIDFHSHVDGKLFSAERLVLQGATTTIGGERNFDGEVIRKISESGFILNHGFLISHSFTLRRAVGISDPYRAATSSERRQMYDLAEQFFKYGVFGIHFGLEFVPGTSFEEIIELANLSKDFDRPVVVHLRRDGHEVLDVFDEVIEITRKIDVAVHVSHLMYMAGYTGVMDRLIDKMRDARMAGYDITGDTGIYDAFPSCIGSSILDGNWKEKYKKGTSVSDVMISSGIYSGEVCNDSSFRYLREEFPNTLVTVSVLDEEEIERALNEDYIYVSTNAADGPHYEHVGHPETAGTFPRLIRKYVREKKTLSLIDAIGKISYLPAKRFGIEKRGEIVEGNAADIVIFDYEKIFDRANYVGKGNPNKEPKGIGYVIVNGEIVAENGKIIPKRNPGKMLVIGDGSFV